MRYADASGYPVCDKILRGLACGLHTTVRYIKRREEGFENDECE